MRDKHERRKGGEGGGSVEGEVVVARLMDLEVRRDGESAPRGAGTVLTTPSLHTRRKGRASPVGVCAD
jgi:hypothetical protein